MLPSLKFLVCGILFCVLLFVMTGAGVMMPDSRTRVGEMPEVGRPMMQRSMTEVSAQTQLYMMAAARRNDEAEQLRERESAQTAAVQPDPGPPTAEAMADETAEPQDSSPAAIPAPDDAAAENAEPAGQDRPAEAGEATADDRRDKPAPQQLAAFLPQTAEPQPAEVGESAPRFVNVPLPHPRPTAFPRRQGRLFHRKHRVAPQRDTSPQAVAASQNFQGTGYGGPLIGQ